MSPFRLGGNGDASKVNSRSKGGELKMPFKSKAQARFMFAKHPRIAKRFAKETKSFKSLPNRISGKRKKR